MKRRSFIASLFAVSTAPVVAKAVAAKAVPVVGKIEGPESVGRYEAVESHDADGPIVLSGNVEITTYPNAEPSGFQRFPVNRHHKYRITCERISDLGRLMDTGRKWQMLNIEADDCYGFVAGTLSDLSVTMPIDGSVRYNVEINVEHAHLTPRINANQTATAMR